MTETTGKVYTMHALFTVWIINGFTSKAKNNDNDEASHENIVNVNVVLFTGWRNILKNSYNYTNQY